MIASWGAGPDLFCLHCSLARGRAWAGFAKNLAGWRIQAPDLIGHGEAAPFDPAQDLHDQTTAAVAGLLPDAPVPLVGHSFGATVALRLAIEMPERVSSLVLYEPVLFAAAGAGPGRAATRARDDIAPILAAGRPADALARFLSVWGFAGADDLSEEQRAYMVARVSLIPAAAPTLNEDRARLLPRLGQVRVPVLLVEGAHSPPVIPEIMEGLARALPDARREVMADAGHMGPITHPTEFADHVARHLGP